MCYNFIKSQSKLKKIPNNQRTTNSDKLKMVFVIQLNFFKVQKRLQIGSVGH